MKILDYQHIIYFKSVFGEAILESIDYFLVPINYNDQR